MESKQIQIKFPAWLKRFIFFLVLAVVAGMLVGWRVWWLRTGNAPVSVNSEQNEQLVGKLKIGKTEVKVEIASSAEERSKGLSGRDSLDEEKGMLFVFERPGRYGFWMKGMKFGLDFVWIERGRVTEITEDVKPSAADNFPRETLPVYQPKQLIEAMLEVNAGWAKRHGVEVGNGVVLE